MWDLTWYNPERLWTVTKALVAAAPDEEFLFCLGAGSVENLLFTYGEQFIERIEQHASIDTNFRRCLAAVCESGIKDEIRVRVTAPLGEQ